jgi:hypothetical protein
MENSIIYLLASKNYYTTYESNDILNDLDKNHDILLKNDIQAYILFEGFMIYKCSKCHNWQENNIRNEYSETCRLLKYNPPTDPMLHYSDSYFYCSKCDEYNFIDSEDLNEYLKNGRLKINNYKITNKAYFFKENTEDETVTYEDSELYDKYNRKKGPINLLSLNEKLVNFIMVDDYDDDYEHVDNCFQYYPYDVYHKFRNND